MSKRNPLQVQNKQINLSCWPVLISCEAKTYSSLFLCAVEHRCCPKNYWKHINPPRCPASQVFFVLTRYHITLSSCCNALQTDKSYTIFTPILATSDKKTTAPSCFFKNCRAILRFRSPVEMNGLGVERVWKTDCRFWPLRWIYWQEKKIESLKTDDKVESGALCQMWSKCARICMHICRGCKTVWAFITLPLLRHNIFLSSVLCVCICSQVCILCIESADARSIWCVLRVQAYMVRVCACKWTDPTLPRSKEVIAACFL